MNQPPTMLYDQISRHRAEVVDAVARERLAAQLMRARRASHSRVPGAPILARTAHRLSLALDRIAIALCSDCFDVATH